MSRRRRIRVRITVVDNTILSSTLPLAPVFVATGHTARDDMMFSRFRTGIRSTPFRHFLLTPFKHLAWFIDLLLHCIITILKHLIRYTLYTIPRLLYYFIIRNANSVAPFSARCACECRALRRDTSTRNLPTDTTANLKFPSNSSLQLTMEFFALSPATEIQ